jgi:hypothetical protein
VNCLTVVCLSTTVGGCFLAIQGSSAWPMHCSVVYPVGLVAAFPTGDRDSDRRGKSRAARFHLHWDEHARLFFLNLIIDESKILNHHSPAKFFIGAPNISSSSWSLALNWNSPGRILFTEPQIAPSGEDGANDWRDPEKPKLSQSPTTNEYCRAGAPRWID